MKCVFFDVNDRERSAIEGYFKGKDIKLSLYIEDISFVKQEDVDADIVSVFIHSRINKEVLDKFKNLKYIFTRSTGFDHIDLNECKARGIAVCNVPDYGSQTVAEYTFWLMLSLLRGGKEILNGEVVLGKELSGKTIGIIGAGRIGTIVAKIAKAFGMSILYNSHKPNPDIESLGGKFVDLNYLLQNSDIITLHVPLTNETYHLINKENVKLIKRGAYLINTARGGVVDTDALLFALDTGILAGVALDVIEGEEFRGKEIEVIREDKNYEDLKLILENNILKNYKNVILTPHVAYYTEEGLLRIIQETLENIGNVLLGKELKNRVI